MFAMAEWNALIERLPTVLASLAMLDIGKRVQQHLIIGVQTTEELEVDFSQIGVFDSCCANDLQPFQWHMLCKIVFPVDCLDFDMLEVPHNWRL